MSNLQPSMEPPASIPLPEAMLFAEPPATDLRIARLPKDIVVGAETGETAIDSQAETVESTPELLREITAELALHDVEPELEAAAVVLGPRLSGHKGPEIREELLAREKAFFVKFVTANLEMAARQDGPVVALLDIDFTITHDDKRLARPALVLAVRELDNILGDRFQLGILSSRPREGKPGESLVSELEHPTYTAGISHKLNPDFLISSGDLERSDEAVYAVVHGNDPEAQIEAAKDVLDPLVIEAMRAGKVTRSFYDTRLVSAQKLIEKYPDHAFIIVDDMTTADAIRRDSPHIKGLRVHEEVLFGGLKPYSGTSQNVNPEEPELLAA